MDDLLDPCGHARPQADSQLHGICVFCWRDRASALRAQLAALREAARLIRIFITGAQTARESEHGIASVTLAHIDESLRAALVDTEASAHAYVERIRAEERERIAQHFEVPGQSEASAGAWIARSIRALGPEKDGGDDA